MGSSLAKLFLEQKTKIGGLELVGIENFSRHGSELNRLSLKKLGVRLFYGDIRNQEDVRALPPVDWVIDAAANPSVLAGIDGTVNSRQVLDNNLGGTINLLEYCKKYKAGLIILSTSRVYSIRQLSNLPLTVHNEAFQLDTTELLPTGVSEKGLNEDLSTAPPISLYGVSKISSELIALEYGDVFGFPVWINRCGVLAGAGQFGRPDQGIFSFWVNAYLRNWPLKYIGYNGKGYQVRDCLHPKDLSTVLLQQIQSTAKPEERIFNLGGGLENSISLRQLNRWCANKYGPKKTIEDKSNRTYDVPWVIMDYGRAHLYWNWQPQIRIYDTLEEIAQHAEHNCDWLEISGLL